MKRFCPVIFLPLLLLSGCNQNNEEPTPSKEELHYNEVEEFHIEWKNLLKQKSNKYYAYVYSVSCVPCSMLRETAIEFGKHQYVDFYFIYPSDDIPFTTDMALVNNSIGATSIENVYCSSTPSLFEITEGTVTSYSNDYYEIKAFMESYMGEVDK